jgi:predicted RNA-binding Zn-ribbon protein involved in translation (DUF1610 family)
MKWISGVLVMVLSFFFRTDSQAKAKSGKQKDKLSEKKQEQKMEEKKIILSRAEITKKLKLLKANPLPKNLSQGAECYEVAEISNRIEYNCPICGTKTIYAAINPYKLIRDLPYIRSLVSKLSLYQIALDESLYCPKCGKNSPNPRLCITIPYQEDGKTIYRKCDVNAEDIKLLSEFLGGSDRHADEYDIETPLVDYIKRITEIFGVKD